MFNARTAAIQGSGWGWLVYNKRKDALSFRIAYNQDPITDVSPYVVPIIGIDVWEHAYYIDYKNARPKYLENIWRIINWQKAEERLIAAHIESEAEKVAAEAAAKQWSSVTKKSIELIWSTARPASPDVLKSVIFEEQRERDNFWTRHEMLSEHVNTEMPHDSPDSRSTL